MVLELSISEVLELLRLLKHRASKNQLSPYKYVNYNITIAKLVNHLKSVNSKLTIRHL